MALKKNRTPKMGKLRGINSVTDKDKVFEQSIN
jgi:hypothetical protein